MTVAMREGLDVVDIKRESHSAKETGQRPVFNEILDGLRLSKFDAILTWAPDRISRNAGDLGKIVDLMDSGLLREIRTYNQKFSNNPNEKFLLMILGSQAKLENDNKRINVKRGLKTRVEMGLWPGVAPLGYMNDRRLDHKCEVLLDPQRAPMVRRIFEKVGNEGVSGRQIAIWLTKENFRSKTGKFVTLSTVYEVLKNPFYTGSFEYPRKSGNWYTGKHAPIVTQDLFERARARVGEQNKPRKQGNSFAFTKMMRCGYCGSGISAQEKSKNISDGTVHWYIYYTCTRYNDKECKNLYLREDSLILQLGKIIDNIEIDELGARHLIEAEVERYNRLRSAMLGVNEKDQAEKMDVRRYAKYLLEEGSIEQKRQLLEHLQGKILIKDKKIYLDTGANDQSNMGGSNEKGTG